MNYLLNRLHQFKTILSTKQVKQSKAPTTNEWKTVKNGLHGSQQAVPRTQTKKAISDQSKAFPTNEWKSMKNGQQGSEQPAHLTDVNKKDKIVIVLKKVNSNQNVKQFKAPTTNEWKTVKNGLHGSQQAVPTTQTKKAISDQSKDFPTNEWKSMKNGGQGSFIIIRHNVRMYDVKDEIMD